MFVAIDIGNTNITIGVHKHGQWQEHRIGSVEIQPLAYYTQQLSIIAGEVNKEKLEGVGISSVVPNLTDIIMDATKLVLHKEPVLLARKWYSLLPVVSANPDEMGTDLLANSLAGFKVHEAPCLIVDFGTALTYTLIRPDGFIEGVAIAPGIKTAMQSLSGNAAQLPEISLKLPDNPLGTNTVEAMNSGILWGFVGQVSFMVNKIKAEADFEIKIIATGGLSEVLKPLENEFDVIDRNLTVEGIREFVRIVQSAQP
ncbi:MAG: type III pantothenate kinase [Bacteroidota bacterium]